MTDRIQISVEEVQELQRRRREINLMEVDEIEFTYQGKPIFIPKHEIEDWKYVGLGSIDFVEFVVEKYMGLDVEQILMDILKEEIVKEFALQGITQEDIDRPIVEAIRRTQNSGECAG